MANTNVRLSPPPGLAIAPYRRYLDKDRQDTDIADIFSRVPSEMEQDTPRANRGPLSGSLNS